MGSKMGGVALFSDRFPFFYFSSCVWNVCKKEGKITFYLYKGNSFQCFGTFFKITFPFF